MRDPDSEAVRDFRAATNQVRDLEELLEDARANQRRAAADAYSEAGGGVLSKIAGVSRQTIHNWMKGEQQ